MKFSEEAKLRKKMKQIQNSNQEHRKKTTRCYREGREREKRSPGNKESGTTSIPLRGRIMARSLTVNSRNGKNQKVTTKTNPAETDH